MRQDLRVALRIPDLDAIGIFILGDGVHGSDELHGAGLAAKLAAQVLDEREEASGGQGVEVAFGEFSLSGAELFAQLLHALLARGEVLMQAILVLDGNQAHELCA
jgi:hypothetical protein